MVQREKKGVGGGPRPTYQNVSLDIRERGLSALPEGLVLAVNPVVLADVLLEAPNRQRLFLLTEPGGGTREVGKDPVAEERDRDGSSSLDDEKPSYKVS